MNGICACCGQPMPDDYADLATQVGLSRGQTNLFLAVAKGRGRVISYGYLIDLLWGDDPNGGPENPIAVIRAFVHHIKTKLAGEGVTIECVWGQGYRLMVSQKDAA